MTRPIPLLPGEFEAASLYELAVRDATDPALFVEVHPGVGRSTAGLVALLAAAQQTARILAVGSWFGVDVSLPSATSPRLSRDLFPDFQAAVDRSGGRAVVEAVRRPGPEVAATIPDGSVDLVFLATGQDYHAALAELRAWWPKLDRRGRIGGVGLGRWPGTSRAVLDLLGPVDVLRDTGVWMAQKAPDRLLRSLLPVPKIGVITPYHAVPAAHFRQCVQSVRNQSVPCVHYIVCDGPEPLWPDAILDARVIHLPGPHGDVGNAARAVGATLAAAEECDAIAFLDADNWYEPDHLASLLDRQTQTGAMICSAGRMLHRLDGQTLGPCPEVDGETFVDTNCLLLFRPAFGAIGAWAAVPRAHAAVGDRFVWNAILQSGHRRDFSGLPTVHYRTPYKVHYDRFGAPVPAGAKVLVHEPTRTITRHVRGSG